MSSSFGRCIFQMYSMAWEAMVEVWKKHRVRLRKVLKGAFRQMVGDGVDHWREKHDHLWVVKDGWCIHRYSSVVRY